MSWNIFGKSKTERNRKSTETRDNYFRNVESDLSNLWIGVETGALEQSVILAKIQQLLPKYQSLISWITSAEWSGATKRQLKHRLNEDIQDLQRMEWDLKKHNYANLSEYKKRLCELEHFYTQYEQARQIVTLWWRTSNIHTIIDSKEDARRARRYEKSDARYHQSMNAILHDAALTSLWNDDMERYEEYLEAVVNWQVEPSSHPFYQAHCQSFKIIALRNPSLYQILTPSWKWRVQYVIPVTWKIDWRTSSWSTRIFSGQSEAFPSRIWKAFWEALSNIFPTIENNPRQKQAWEQAGSVLALWWAIFMWVKMLKNIFSKKESNPNKRWNALWWWAGLLALTNGDRIFKWGFNWIQDAFNRHPAEKIQASTELFEKYWFSDDEALKYSEMQVWAPVTTISALHFIPIDELGSKRIVEYEDNQFKFNYDNYEKYVNACDWTDAQKNTVLEEWKKLRNNGLINLWFIWLWIKDWNQFNWLANWSKDKTLVDCPEIQRAWKNNSELLKSSVNEELFNQWLKPIDTDAQKQIVEDYNAHLWDKIKKSELKQLIVSRMKEWLLEINGKVEYDLNEMLNNPDIDLENMTMKWFKTNWWQKIRFKSYKQLFDAVNLTKLIKEYFRWRSIVNKEDKPFHIAKQKPGRPIQFDDTEWYEVRKNETDVVNWRTIRENTTLRNNYQFYIDYLNEWRQNWGHVKL